MALVDYEGDVQPLYDYYISLDKDVYLQNRITGETSDYELALEVAKIARLSRLKEYTEDVQEYYARVQQTNEGLVGSADFQSFV